VQSFRSSGQSQLGRINKVIKKNVFKRDLKPDSLSLSKMSVGVNSKFVLNFGYKMTILTFQGMVVRG